MKCRSYSGRCQASVVKMLNLRAPEKMLCGHGPYSSRTIRILLSTKILIFPSNVDRFQISIIGCFLIISISNSLEKKLSVDPSGGLCEARVDNHSSLFTHLSNKVY